METEVQPDSGLWAFVVTWRWRQDSASIFKAGLARDGWCCHRLCHVYEGFALISLQTGQGQIHWRLPSIEVGHTCVSCRVAQLLLPSIVAFSLKPSAVLFALHTGDSAWEGYASHVCLKKRDLRDIQDGAFPLAMPLIDDWCDRSQLCCTTSLTDEKSTLWPCGVFESICKKRKEGKMLWMLNPFQTKLYMTAGLPLNPRKLLVNN